MSVDRYAQFESVVNGAVLHRHSGIWWRRVCWLFYRPLLPYQGYDLCSIRTSARCARPGACFQHAVLPGQPCNSHFNLMVYDRGSGFGANRLHKCERRSLRKALSSSVEVRVGVSLSELRSKGLPVMASFAERSNYALAVRRATPQGFLKYMTALNEFPEVKVMGAYLGDEILGFETSCRVNDVVHFLGMVHSNQGLKLRTPCLIQHSYRHLLEATPGVTLVFDGFAARKQSLNEHKLQQGARLVSMPAHAHAHSLVCFAFRLFSGK